MDTNLYKDRLLALEKDFSGREQRELAQGQSQVADSSRDSGEAGAATETATESFSAAKRDSTMLQQVRDALKRIDEGRFGMCVVDGEPIEAARLHAAPWAERCLKHQEQVESAASA